MSFSLASRHSALLGEPAPPGLALTSARSSAFVPAGASITGMTKA